MEQNQQLICPECGDPIEEEDRLICSNCMDDTPAQSLNRGKYALIRLDKMGIADGYDVEEVARIADDNADLIEIGTPGAEDEFFVLKLKDVHALPALLGYARSCKSTDPQLSKYVTELAERAGKNNPYCREPD